MSSQYDKGSCNLLSKFDAKGEFGKFKYADETQRIAAYKAGKIRVLNGNINLIDPVLLGRYTALVLDIGVVGSITYGYRSFKEQEEIFFNHGGTKDSKGNYIKPSSWKGGEVATPGSSYHEYGLAIDTADEAIRSIKKESHTLELYGLHKPLSAENWHLQLIECNTSEVAKRKEQSPTNLITSAIKTTSGAKGPDKPTSQIIHNFKSKMVSRGFHRHFVNALLGTVEKECSFICREVDLNFKSVASVRENFGLAKKYTDAQISSWLGNKEVLADHVIEGGYKYRGRGFIQITGKGTYSVINSILKDYIKNPPNILDNPEKVITDYETSLWAAIAYVEYKFNLKYVAERIGNLSDLNKKCIEGKMTLETIACYLGAIVLGGEGSIVKSGGNLGANIKLPNTSNVRDVKERAENAKFYHKIYDII